MAKESHPLIGNKKWTFNQPELGFRAHYIAVDKKTGEKEPLTLEVSSTCRESVVYNTRATFQTRLTNINEVRGWNGRTKKPVLVPLRDCDLIDPAGKTKPTELKIHWYSGYRSGWGDFPVEKFIRVCDTVIGPVAVLLGPWRPEGDKWWRTDPKKALKGGDEQGYVHWNGTDSWFLAHPATAAIALGLYRQCFHLCGAGVADEIIDTLSEEEISEVMSTNSQKLALLLIKKTRNWIEVPVGENGYRVNYSFPLGFWRRLIRLQRAIRKVGYEETIGQTFHEGWATTGGTEFRGAYSFWGDEGELTNHHKHLMKIGAPRRQTRVTKSASGTT